MTVPSPSRAGPSLVSQVGRLAFRHHPNSVQFQNPTEVSLDEDVDFPAPGRDVLVKEIADRVDLKRKFSDLNALAAASFAVYGAIIGSQHSLKQALSSSVKLPLLFLLTAVVCIPTLFILSSFLGSRRTLLQYFALLSAGSAVMCVALVGFAPITLFFIVTTHNYQFFKVLNVVFFAVSGLLGVLFFKRMYIRLSDDGTPAMKSRHLLLQFWLLLFAFVGTQLAWTLRPFFGAPHLPIEIVREVGGNFYTDVFEAGGELFGQRKKRQKRPRASDAGQGQSAGVDNSAPADRGKDQKTPSTP